MSCGLGTSLAALRPQMQKLSWPGYQRGGGVGRAGDGAGRISSGPRTPPWPLGAVSSQLIKGNCIWSPSTCHLPTDYARAWLSLGDPGKHQKDGQGQGPWHHPPQPHSLTTTGCEASTLQSSDPQQCPPQETADCSCHPSPKTRHCPALALTLPTCTPTACVPCTHNCVLSPMCAPPPQVP